MELGLGQSPDEILGGRSDFDAITLVPAVLSPGPLMEVDLGHGLPSSWGEVTFAGGARRVRLSETIGSRKGAKMASNIAQAVQAPGSICPPVIGGDLLPER
jgi:hypothetical protein